MLRGIVQFDTLNEVNIRLSDGSKAFNYDGYTNIVFKVLKADGTAYIDSEGENVIATSPVDGIITVNLTGQSTTAAGLCQSVLEVYSGDGKMTTARFNYEVFEDLDLDEAVESTTEYPALQNLMMDLSALESAIESAEAARVTAEAERASEASGYVAQAEAAKYAASVSAATAEEWARQAKSVAGGNFAPAGYGLGEEELYVVDRTQVDSIRKAGWYVFYDIEDKIEGNGSGFIECKGMNRGITGTCVQEFYASAYGTPMLKRYFDGVAWTPWEWMNPDMKLGVEYRTTERYLGKPVYKKLVDFGALPNATTKTVSAGFENGYIIGIESVFSPNQGHCFYNHSDISSIGGSATNIIITTKADMSAYSVRIVVKYYKTTDT